MRVDSIGRRINSKSTAHLLKHGGFKHYRKTYQCWQDMKQRCFNPNVAQYKNYGARGIKVCDRWMKFEFFFADMGEKPDGMSIERINVDGDYSPENCKWASNAEQQNNKRTCHFIEFDGRKMTRSAWAKELGVHEVTLKYRLSLGLPLNDVMVAGRLNRMHFTKISAARGKK